MGSRGRLPIANSSSSSSSRHYTHSATLPSILLLHLLLILLLLLLIQPFRIDHGCDGGNLHLLHHLLRRLLRSYRRRRRRRRLLLLLLLLHITVTRPSINSRTTATVAASTKGRDGLRSGRWERYLRIGPTPLVAPLLTSISTLLHIINAGSHRGIITVLF